MVSRVLMYGIVTALLAIVAEVSCAQTTDSHVLTIPTSSASAGSFTLSAQQNLLDESPPTLEIRPFQYSSSESSPWRKAPVVLAGTAVLYRHDADVQQWAQQNRSPSTDKLATFGKQFGEPNTYIAPMIALFLYGSLADDDRARDTALITGESLIACGIITHSIKHAVNRHRPGDIEEEEPFEGRTRLSFPSGHTSVAFTAATVAASKYGDNDLVPIIAYTLASLAGWSRINDNVHWASDVLFGSYVGYLAAKGVLSLSDEDDDITSAFHTPCPVSLRFSF